MLFESNTFFFSIFFFVLVVCEAAIALGELHAVEETGAAAANGAVPALLKAFKRRRDGPYSEQTPRKMTIDAFQEKETLTKAKKPREMKDEVSISILDSMMETHSVAGREGDVKGFMGFDSEQRSRVNTACSFHSSNTQNYTRLVHLTVNSIPPHCEL